MKLFLLLTGLSLGASVVILGQDDRFLPEVSGQRIDREGYTMIWDSETRFPKIITYELTREELNGQETCGARYHDDPELDEHGNAFYEGAAEVGFERGHMLPASHGRYSVTSCEHASFYSNIIPQRDSLNQGGWRDTELRAEALAAQHGKVYVHSGPIPMYLGALPSGMLYPNGFWKVLLYSVDGVWTKESYLFTQMRRKRPREFRECGNDLVIEWIAGFEPFNRDAVSPLPRPSIANSIRELSLEELFESKSWKTVQTTINDGLPGLPSEMLPPYIKSLLLVDGLRMASMWIGESAIPAVREEGYSCIGKLLLSFEGVLEDPLFDESVIAFENAAEIGLILMEKPTSIDIDPAQMTTQQKRVARHLITGAIAAYKAGDCDKTQSLSLKALTINVNQEMPLNLYQMCDGK